MGARRHKGGTEASSADCFVHSRVWLAPPSPPSGSQLLITFACQPRLLICYHRAESGRSNNKGDTVTLRLLSSPIQISLID